MQQSLGIMLRRAVESVVCVAQFSLVPHLINIQCLGHGLELAATKNHERQVTGSNKTIYSHFYTVNYHVGGNHVRHDKHPVPGACPRAGCHQKP